MAVLLYLHTSRYIENFDSTSVLSFSYGWMGVPPSGSYEQYYADMYKD
jgi:hypothetical protein